MIGAQELLELADLPPCSSRVVDLAVSGGADSVGLALLAHAKGLTIHLHHVDHQLRSDSSHDAELVRDLGERLGVPVSVYTVDVDLSRGVEAGARAARRSVLPTGVLTGHTMDDLAETVILNLLRGAGLEGLSPMVGDATKPLLNIRRRDLRDFVVASGESFVDDPTNSDTSLRRNAVRHELLPQMNKWAQRDVIPIVARQANLIADDVAWLETLSADDVAVGLDHDCREVREWPLARQRRWVRGVFLSNDADGHHPPTAAEVERVLAVIRGDVVAAELSGSRRVSRRDQRLSVTTIPPATLSADE